jgi:hypothetical protein
MPLDLGFRARGLFLQEPVHRRLEVLRPHVRGMRRLGEVLDQLLVVVRDLEPVGELQVLGVFRLVERHAVGSSPVVLLLVAPFSGNGVTSFSWPAAIFCRIAP